MVTVSSFWFMLLIELLIATTLVSVVLIVFNILRKSRDRKAAASIIQKIKEDEQRRRAETKKIMIHKFGFDDDTAEKLTVKIDREELAFYQKIINMYLLRDAAVLDALNIIYESSVTPYRKLDPPGGGSSTHATNASGEIAHLKKENKRLSEEIAVTMQTMGRMLGEYSTMFADKAKEQADDISDGEVAPDQAEPIPPDSADQEEGVDELATVEAEGGGEEESEDPTNDVEQIDGGIADDMDDLSDLDPQEDDDLKGIEKPENADELIG